MSSTFERSPFHSPENNGPSAVPGRMTSPWGRLFWKDAREIVPAWITLALAAVLCLMVTCWMVNREMAHIAPLYLSGHTFIALCSIITGVFLLANEDENRTLHLLRNLPLRPRQILLQKIMLGGVGVLAIACLIALMTTLLAGFVEAVPLKDSTSYRFTYANVTLLPLLYLTIALSSAMLSRSHFYGVLIAGFVSIGVVWMLEPTWLGARESQVQGRSGIRWLWVALAILGGGSALVLNASHWVEEKVTTFKLPKTSRASANSLALSAEIADLQLKEKTANPFLTLIWQSVRQTRVPLLCCFSLVIVGWIAVTAAFDYSHRVQSLPQHVIASTKSYMTFFWMLAMMIAFASTIFLDDKRQGNFRFFQQNRERPRWFWLSRLLPFWALALVLVLAWNLFIFDFGSDFLSRELRGWSPNPRYVELLVSYGMQAASQSLLVPLLSMFGIVGVGQYFSMFVRNPILAFVFTGIVSAVFLAISGYVVFVNESVWWSVLPIIVAVYFATWWRSETWLATAPRATQFFLPLAMPAVVLAITAPLFIHHRASEFKHLEVSPVAVTQWANDIFVSEKQRRAYRVEFGTQSQAEKAADLYRTAAGLWQGTYFPNGGMDVMPWPAKKTAGYVTKNEVPIAKIVEAAEVPICAPLLVSDQDYWALREMALANAHHQILTGKLAAAKQGIDAYDRVYQRTAGAQNFNRYESGYYGLLISWADHPDQDIDSIRSAIAQLEGSESDIRPLVMVDYSGKKQPTDSQDGIAFASLYREFGGEQAYMKFQREVAYLKQDSPNSQIHELKHNFWLWPWEYERVLKVAQLREAQTHRWEQVCVGIRANLNDVSVNQYRLQQHLSSIILEPKIPIEEDRGGFHSFGIPYSTARNIVDEVNWRRYALLRLGLAAYKIEHKAYPKKLAELEPYYQRRLPLTTDGMSFGWFPDGVGQDFIAIYYEGKEKGETDYARVIVDGKSPVLFPMSIDPSKMGEPVEYGNGKSGIDFHQMNESRNVINPLIYNGFSYYKISWKVGDAGLID